MISKSKPKKVRTFQTPVENSSNDHLHLSTTLHTLALYYFDLSQHPTEDLNHPEEFTHLALCCLNAAFQFTELPPTKAIENRLQTCRIYLNLEPDPNYYNLLQENLSKALLLCQKLSIGHDLYFELRVLQLRVLNKYQKRSQAQVVLLQTLEEAQQLGLYAWCFALLTYVDQWETPPVLTICQKYWEQDPTPILMLTFLQLRHCYLTHDRTRYNEFRKYFSKLSSLPNQFPDVLQYHVLFWDLLYNVYIGTSIPSSLLQSVDTDLPPFAPDTSKVNLSIQNQCPSTLLLTYQTVQIDFQCSVNEIFILCQFLRAIVLKREADINNAEKLLKLVFQKVNELKPHSKICGLKPLILNQLFECSLSRSQFTLAGQLLELFCLSPCLSTLTFDASAVLTTSIAFFLQTLGYPSAALSIVKLLPQEHMSILTSLQLNLDHSINHLPSLPKNASPLFKITQRLFETAWEPEVNTRKKMLLDVLRSTEGLPQLQCLSFTLGGCLHSFSDLEKSKNFFECSLQLTKRHHYSQLNLACTLAHEFITCLLSETLFTSDLDISKLFVSDSKKALEGLVAIFDKTDELI